jgi:hypothetical protein
MEAKAFVEALRRADVEHLKLDRNPDRIASFADLFNQRRADPAPLMGWCDLDGGQEQAGRFLRPPA